jgi:hypothetical protein
MGIKEPLAAYQLNNEWFVINKSGKILFSSKSILDVESYSEHLLGTYAFIGEGDIISAYLDNGGKVMVMTPSRKPYPFREGVAFILVETDGKEKEFLYGATDKYGEMIIPLQYLDMEPFSDGLAYVMNAKERGYVTTTGKFAFKLDSGYAGYGFSEGLSAVSNTAVEKFGYVNKSGEVVIDYLFDEAGAFSNGLARVFLQNEYGRGAFGYINKKGHLVIKNDYEDASPFKENRAFVAVLNLDEDGFLYALINSDGLLMSGYIFPDHKDFSEGVVAVQCADKLWRYIDKNGKYVDSIGYKYAGTYSSGAAFVITQDDALQFIDKSGKLLISIPKDAAIVFDCRTNERKVVKESN